MRIFIKILIVFMIILGLLMAAYSFLQSNNIDNYTSENIIKTNEENQIIIKDGKITFENLLDDFINSEKTEETKLIINEYENGEKVKIKELKFVFGKTENVGAVSLESIKEAQGYYIWIVNGEIKNDKLYIMDYELKRKVENEIIIVYLYDYINKNEIELFSYTLESSNYSSGFYLKYNQRKDLGITKVFREKDFDVYEFGGDVKIIINDIEYTFEDALEKNIITSENILKQAKLDAKYGICTKGYYSDGGSTEYCYPEYTILKLNTLDGNKDMIIGYSGQIINDFDKLMK